MQQRYGVESTRNELMRNPRSWFAQYVLVLRRIDRAQILGSWSTSPDSLLDPIGSVGRTQPRT